MARKDTSRREGSGEAPLERLRTLGDPALRQRDQRRHRVRYPPGEARVSDARGDAPGGWGRSGRPPDRRAQPHHGLERPRARATRSTSSSTPRSSSGRRSAPRAAEGCLSVPGCTVKCRAGDEVMVHAQDLQGTPFELEAAGLVARIMQHEIDHLDGRLILDRADPEERRRVLKELRERIAGDGRVNFAFAGSPDFAAWTLEHLVGLEPPSQPGHLAARPAGRPGTAHGRASGGDRCSASGPGPHPARRYQCS